MAKEVLLYVGTLLISFEIIKKISDTSIFMFQSPWLFMSVIGKSIDNYRKKHFHISTDHSINTIEEKCKRALNFLISLLIFGFKVVAWLLLLAFTSIPIMLILITGITTILDTFVNCLYKPMLGKSKDFYTDSSPAQKTYFAKYWKWADQKNAKQIKEIDEFLRKGSLPFTALAGIICITISFIMELTT